MQIKLLSMFLLALVPFVFNGSYNLIIDILNYLITAIGPAATRVVGLFPANPCGSLIASCSDAVVSIGTPDATFLSHALNAIAWLLPMSYLANLVGCAMLTIMIYFTMAPLARWFKLLS